DAALQFLEMKHADEVANALARECSNPDVKQLIRTLAARDGQVLRLVNDEIKPGPAFRARPSHAADYAEDDGEVDEATPAGETALPENISGRVRNLYLLNLDLRGELEAWLKPTSATSANGSRR